ncbi:MAG: penicillin-binding protein 2 [Bacteroidetes bacterium]|nr:penicillin-binding protein 2 [Bacteroidota bacterium]
MPKYNHLINRKLIIGGFFCLIALIYLGRLFYLQVIDDQYIHEAQANAFRYLTEYPVRGYIYDRNGKLLVMNDISYDLMIIPKETKGCDTMALCEILEIDKEEYLKRYKKACVHPNSPRKQSFFEKQLDRQTYAKLQEKMYRFKGFFVQKRTVRKYPRPIAAHLLGYVGEVSSEKAEKDSYYKEGDYIGISGIERSYEEELRGKKGTQIAITDVHNKTVGRYMNGKYDTLAIPGKPLYCSIDMDLQEYGEKLMHGKKGAVVAIEPSTGEILCLVSSPGYDPNELVGGKERTKCFARLYSDTVGLPLFNRALTAMYPPGSTFKLIDALIGQDEGVITRSTVYPCARGYPPMGGKPKCHPHGAEDLIGSIAVSCNSYYSYVFKDITSQKKFKKYTDGFEHWRNVVKTFGPGTRLGTDLPYDKPGNVPSVQYYDKVFGKNRWFANTIVSLGIGQAELLLVPLQMANVIAIIANKGFYYTPHCIKGVSDSKQLDKKFKEKHLVGVQKEECYKNVIDGMQKCFEPGGTGFASKIPGIIACGKTGTAENPHGKSHAVFQAFAPREQPKIAIACLVENAGWGGVWAAPVVSLMIEKYLTGKITRPDLEKRIMAADLINGKNLLSTEFH